MQFKRSSPETIGIEIELQVLDARNLDLTNGVLPLLRACPNRDYVKPEYIQFTVEIASKVCWNIVDLHRHLQEQLAMLCEAADSLGMSLAAAGTHPFCENLGQVTPTPRYARVEQDTGYVGYSQITYALHVHVGMRSGGEAIAIMNRLRPYLPALLALSANSPYWRGHDTGFASYRQRVLMAAHAFGTPPQLAAWEDFERLVAASERARIFESYSDMHWDIRPRPDYGSLEIRVMDVQPTLLENVALAALVRALIAHLRASPPARTLPVLPMWLEQENQYRASHTGLGCECIVSPEGDTLPMRKLVADMLHIAAEAAQRYGEEEYLEPAFELLRHGSSSQRQRDLYRQHGTFKAVVATMMDWLYQDVGITQTPALPAPRVRR